MAHLVDDRLPVSFGIADLISSFISADKKTNRSHTKTFDYPGTGQFAFHSAFEGFGILPEGIPKGIAGIYQ